MEDPGQKEILSASLTITPEVAALVNPKLAGASVYSEMEMEYLDPIEYKQFRLYPVAVNTMVQVNGSEDTNKSQEIQYFGFTDKGLELIGTQKKIKKLNKPKLLKVPKLIVPIPYKQDDQWKSDDKNGVSVCTVAQILPQLVIGNESYSDVVRIDCEDRSKKLPFVGHITGSTSKWFSPERGLIRSYMHDMKFPDIEAKEKKGKSGKIIRAVKFGQAIMKLDYKLKVD